MSAPTPATVDGVLDVLRGIPAPHLDMNLVEARMIADVEASDSAIALRVDYPIPPNPVEDALTAAIRAALAERFPGPGEVRVRTSVSIPSHDSPQKAAILPGVKNTVAVASGKGGVGKSTVAVNLAVALARAGARVGLVDADIYGPSVPTMMGIHQQPMAYDDGGKTRLLPCDNHGVKVMSIGFLVEPDTAMIWRGPMAGGALKQFLTDVDWGAIDYLVFDMPPGTGDIQLTLSQTLPLNGAVIVTTPQDISLVDARKGVRMFERVSVPILGIVENMSGYVCPHCGQRDDIFSAGGGRAAAEDLGVPFLGDIPIVTRVREAGDAGTPIVALDPDGPVGRGFADTAMRLAGAIARAALLAAPPPRIDISL